ncbi:transglycosylase domain-containing protein [Amphritea atlantica]|uniref:Transglycosylase domain-containing protein n=1 Tax=Amphritea atlantica TaxID=355243 RepID=A0ABY5GYH4_9GAMM|nr:transglycosylase domain-containing protein [Amphritea atlantica]
MSERTLLRFIYYLLTLPVYFIGYLFLKVGVFNFKEKMRKCIQVVDERNNEIPDVFISYLIAAEDHRSQFHYGIDHIGILRALIRGILIGETQGASTIEQQFVRVVTGDYSYSILRKLKEQILAVLLTKKRSKAEVAKAYLAIAYYGHNCDGAKGIESILRHSLKKASEKQIIVIVSRLKYPKPSTEVSRWKGKVDRRVAYIKNRHKNATNKARQRMLRTAARSVNIHFGLRKRSPKVGAFSSKSRSDV